MKLKLFQKPLSRDSSSRNKSDTSAGTATTVSSSSMGTASAHEEIARLEAENRRLRQVTQRIAAKIGVRTCTDKDGHLDEFEPPAPHLILAQAHRLQKLNQLVVELSQVPTVSEAYKIVAQYTREIVGAARVSITILVQDKETGSDHLEVYGLDGQEGALPMGIQLPIQNTQVGKVVTTMKPVRVMSTGPDSGTEAAKWLDIAHLHKMGVMAAVDVPLISSGRVLGTLNTGVTDPAVYYPEVEQILLQIGSVLASAMEKEQLYQQAKAAMEAKCQTCQQQDQKQQE